jgi:hypothetical protein
VVICLLKLEFFFFPKKQGICDRTLSMKKIWPKKKKKNDRLNLTQTPPPYEYFNMITSFQFWPLIPNQILLQGDFLAWMTQLT